MLPQKPDKKFKRSIAESGGDDLNKCYQCATCSAVCLLTPEDHPFPRKEMLLAQWGQSDKLVADPDVWLCHQCNDCTVRCPRGARPGDVMGAIRNYSFEHYAVPGFLGKLVSKPAGLPFLMLIPILIFVFMADWSQMATFSGHVHFYDFLQNGPLEMLFMAGNFIVLLLASFGLIRFYKGMADSWKVKPEIGFIKAAIQTVLEIISHKRFGTCDTSKYRQTAHFLVFYGFFGAAATAGLALMRMEYLHFIHPEHYALSNIPSMMLYHPIKILGNASGLAMIIGIIMMATRHSNDPESAGVSTYAGKIFIWGIFGVAFTGMLIQFLRIGGLPTLAYAFYFIHLVFVFSLLWYAPYSQFGHMFYRTFAMIFARSINRMPQEQ
ncbi:MAG: quinone-interacting membrane-bound oxidoreductase complex subunit QmoC [Calditrichaeota bacterium]|nr:quinone-interacting membrane-bound oxidoreductase complex subunit QmoC [Calditrichota bacterium]